MVYKARGVFGSSPVPLDAPLVCPSLWAQPQPPGHVAGLPLSSPSPLIAFALALAHRQEAKLKKKKKKKKPSCLILLSKMRTNGLKEQCY